MKSSVFCPNCWAGRQHSRLLAEQALLDVYTIQREVGKLEGVKIGLVGDLANGRTARSLAYLLSMYPRVKMYFVAPDVVRMGDDIKEFLDSRGVCYSHLFGPLLDHTLDNECTLQSVSCALKTTSRNILDSTGAHSLTLLLDRRYAVAVVL